MVSLIVKNAFQDDMCALNPCLIERMDVVEDGFCAQFFCVRRTSEKEYRILHFYCAMLLSGWNQCLGFYGIRYLRIPG